jgi:hypothetical protein
LPLIQTQLLELGAVTLTSEHYRLNGYTVTVNNLVEGRFRVKLSARGYPWNYSWFTVSRGDVRFEIHTNVAVESAHGDDGVYVVDVGVCIADRIPRSRPLQGKWTALDNHDLATFVEAKKLVVYPMLLAQFVGIVHEIRPECLLPPPKGHSEVGHHDPALVSTGHPAATSLAIAQGFEKRGFRIAVIPSFDLMLSQMRKGQIHESPFERRLGRDWN